MSRPVGLRVGIATIAPALLVLAACQPPPPPTAAQRASQATMTACRQRADEVFQRQNRATIFTQNDRDAPESAGYVSGITTRGLADRYGWDTQVSDCVRSQGSPGNAGTGFSAGPSPVTGAAPAGGPPR